MFDRLISSIIYPRLRAANYLGLELEELQAVAALAVAEAEATWSPAGGAQLTSWVYRKVQSRVLDAMAKAGRELAMDLEDAPGDDESPEARVLVREAFDYLQARLDPGDLRLLWFAHVEGYSGAELADMWGVTQGNLRVRLHRARNSAVTILAAQG